MTHNLRMFTHLTMAPVASRPSRVLRLVSGLILAALPGAAMAASGNTASDAGASSATVVAPIVLTHDGAATLSFGTFTRGVGGSVTVDPAGNGSTSADVGFVPGSATMADRFTLTGEPGAAYSIATTAGSVTAGSISMPFTTSASASSDVLDSSGAGSFTVGGSLTVAGTEDPGSYIGSYDATVAYN